MIFFAFSRSLRGLLAGVLATFSGLGAAAQQTNFPGAVRVENGLLLGVPSASGAIRSFKGIPFAAPPVGELRWKEPQPVADWAGVKPADRFGPSPMQAAPRPFGAYTAEFLIAESPISEDCLYLNIWTGARSPDEKRPVLVWIYGGGFGAGGTNAPIYDGEALAAKGVIFVSIAYRVGVFGFLAHPELTRESPHGASGHYGLMDQIAGLRWIQRNISAFGGDPTNVTIAGQSTGAMSISALAASPVARGLFRRVIVESGTLLVRGGASAAVDRAAAEQAGVAMASAAGATTVAQLRALPPADLLAAMRGRFGPVVDGYVLTAPVADSFAEGPPPDLDLLTGWNADEYRSVTVVPAATYAARIRALHGANADAFLRNYPGTTNEEAAQSQRVISRDETFAMGSFKWATLQARAKRPVYVYQFTRNLPAAGDEVRYGAFHTAEVPYALGTLRFLKNRPLELVDHALSEQMTSYWANYARTGNPNGPGLPVWPQFNPETAPVMTFSDTVAAGPLPNREGIALILRLTEQAAER